MAQDLQPKDSFRTDEFGGVCFKCRYALPRLSDCSPEYFATGYFVCRMCGEKLDLWKAVTKEAKIFESSPSIVLTSLGAARTSFRRDLQTSQWYEFHLIEYNIPIGAKVLSVVISGSSRGDGAVSALMWHGNVVSKRIHGPKLHVFAVPLGEGKLPRSAPITFSVTWARPGDSDGWLYLLDAFESAAESEFAASLVFGQSAVEIFMMPLVAKQLRRFASADNVQRFMNDSLTYGHVLNVALPTLCGLLKIPQMPESIRGALNVLRKKRNQVMHQGVGETWRCGDSIPIPSMSAP